MSDQTKDPGQDKGGEEAEDERPATPIENDVKTGMHRPGSDPHKQIPAKEGGET